MPHSRIDFKTATIKDLQELLCKGEVTSVQLVTSYLDRIKENNEVGLQLRAVAETSPEEMVLQIAQSLDDLRSNGTVLGGLHGIPLLVKDNIGSDPALGMNTTAGSFALVNSIVPEDATVIAKLRAAGAIILGKTTMTEFGGLKSSTMTRGYSARGGQGQSAYVEGGFANGGDPMASSSGSAIALSAGWAPATLGTETSGSLVAPSGRAAAYTLRPTLGLVSRAGTVPGSKSMDTVGPMAKSVFDIALLLQHMAGSDSKDDTSAAAQMHCTDYTLYTTPPHATFKGKRLGVPRATVFDSEMPWGNEPSKDPKIRSELDAAIKKMEDLGAVICDPADIPSSAEWKQHLMRDDMIVIAHEFKEDLKDYLGTMKRTDVATLRDVIEFNAKHPDLKLPDGELSQDLLLAADTTTGRDAQVYREAIANIRRVCCDDGIDKVMSDLKLDALILPINALSASYAAGGGYPLAAVPLGVQDNGEPFGFCLLGPKWSEPTLLALMAAYEADFPPRAVPQLID